MRSVTSCGRGASRSDPKTSGWWAARGAGLPACAARSWRRWPASAPTTTCGSSRAATRIRRAQVLDALARALRLDVKATEYLHQLANPSIGGRETSASDAHRGPRGAHRPVSYAGDRGQQLPGCAGGQPGRPRACRRVSPPGRTSCAGGYWIPPPATLYVDWDEATDVAVSGLREAAGSDPEDPRLAGVDRRIIRRQ